MNDIFNKKALYQGFFWSVFWFITLCVLNLEDELNSQFWKRTTLTVFGVFIVVYINLVWLLPKFYYRKKYALYVFLSLGMLLAVVWSIHSDHLPWNQDMSTSDMQIEETGEIAFEQRPFKKESDSFRWLFRNLPLLFISLLGSSFISVSRFIQEKQNETISLQKAKLETELKFLKSQINPHFLFNSLNNVYSLTVMQSEKAPDQLLKLSNILRYMLYDSNQEKVPLKREIHYIEDYLNLVKLKDSRGMNIRFKMDIENEDLMIAPLLFIPFLENAVKHSQIEDLNNGYIEIELTTLGNELDLRIDNSIPSKTYSKDGVGGIGLANIKQRLVILYPEKHNLVLKHTDAIFSVNLSLNCS